MRIILFFFLVGCYQYEGTTLESRENKASKDRYSSEIGKTAYPNYCPDLKGINDQVLAQDIIDDHFWDVRITCIKPPYKTNVEICRKSVERKREICTDIMSKNFSNYVGFYD